MEEFNEEHERRKITPFNFLRNTRIFKNAAWIDHVFTLHVLDHPTRQPSDRRTSLEPLVPENPYL